MVPFDIVRRSYAFPFPTDSTLWKRIDLPRERYNPSVDPNYINVAQTRVYIPKGLVSRNTTRRRIMLCHVVEYRELRVRMTKMYGGQWSFSFLHTLVSKLVGRHWRSTFRFWYEAPKSFYGLNDLLNSDHCVLNGKSFFRITADKWVC